MPSNIDEQVKAERREYQRKWRAANPDKTKKHQEDYWRRRAERKLAEQKEIKP